MRRYDHVNHIPEEKEKQKRTKHKRKNKEKGKQRQGDERNQPPNQNHKYDHVSSDESACCFILKWKGQMRRRGFHQSSDAVCIRLSNNSEPRTNSAPPSGWSFQVHQDLLEDTSLIVHQWGVHGRKEEPSSRPSTAKRKTSPRLCSKCPLQ